VARGSSASSSFRSPEAMIRSTSSSPISSPGNRQIQLPAPTPFLEFTRQARQQVDVPHCLDRLFCTRAMPIIPILLTGRRAASSPVHPTDATAANRGRTTALPRSFRFGFAPRRVVGALHGVDGHFDLVTPPTPTGSGCLVSVRIGIGAWELAASRAGDAALRPAPVVTLSAMIA
jgi:hypothetical protein